MRYFISPVDLHCRFLTDIKMRQKENLLMDLDPGTGRQTALIKLMNW